jgi:tetratricopeptide (TPR) repeat protein
MSLINQMLRDLEQRNTAQTSVPGRLDIPLAEPQTASRRYWPWLLVAMLLSIFYAWNSRRDQQLAPEPAVPVATAPPEAVHNQAVVAPKQQAQVTPEPAALPVPVAEAKPTAVPQPIATPPASLLPANKVVTPSRPTQTAPRRTSTPKNQVQALLQQAQGNVSLLMRKETLKEALQLEPDNLRVRDLLLQTLLKSGSGSEVESFLQESLRLFPNHLAFITSLAQLQLQRKDFAAATATLERVESSEPAYLSLLAAGYQQQKRYHNAAEIYQRLTQMQPDKAEYWLGLAISADNLHRRQDAVPAYRQALDKNTLNSEVVDYIKQRLSVLN